MHVARVVILAREIGHHVARYRKPRDHAFVLADGGNASRFGLPDRARDGFGGYIRLGRDRRSGCRACRHLARRRCRSGWRHRRRKRGRSHRSRRRMPWPRGRARLNDRQNGSAWPRLLLDRRETRMHVTAPPRLSRCDLHADSSDARGSIYLRPARGVCSLLRRNAGRLFGEGYLGGTEPHLDEPDRRHGGEISLVHGDIVRLEGGRLATARQRPWRQHVD